MTNKIQPYFIKGYEKKKKQFQNETKKKEKIIKLLNNKF